MLSNETYVYNLQELNILVDVYIDFSVMIKPSLKIRFCIWVMNISHRLFYFLFCKLKFDVVMILRALILCDIIFRFKLKYSRRTNKLRIFIINLKNVHLKIKEGLLNDVSFF